jgi:SAM-dependent methyltransferase
VDGKVCSQHIERFWMKGSWLQRWRHRHRLAPLSKTQAELEAWYNTAVGQMLLQEELKTLQPLLSNMFGYHLLQMSINPPTALFDGARILHCINAASAARPQAGVALHCEYDQLPLADESVDVTVLHHALEFSPNPHQVLKEACRVTIARGHIIIIGFNPFSLHGLVKPFARVFSEAPIWRYKTLRPARVTDWLAFLECSLIKQATSFVNWPVNQPGYLAKTQGLARALSKLPLPVGNFYCLVARKDVVCMTPLRPQWQVPFSGLSKPAVAARAAARLSLVKKSNTNE